MREGGPDSCLPFFADRQSQAGPSLAAIKNLPSANLIPSFSSTLIFKSPHLSRYLACARQLVAGSIGIFVEVDSLRSSLTYITPSLFASTRTRATPSSDGHRTTDNSLLSSIYLGYLQVSAIGAFLSIPIVSTTTHHYHPVLLNSLGSTSNLVSRTLGRAQFTTPSISNRRFPQYGTLVRRRIAPSSVPCFARPLLRCSL